MSLKMQILLVAGIVLIAIWGMQRIGVWFIVKSIYKAIWNVVWLAPYRKFGVWFALSWISLLFALLQSALIVYSEEITKEMAVNTFVWWIFTAAFFGLFMYSRQRQQRSLELPHRAAASTLLSFMRPGNFLRQRKQGGGLLLASGREYGKEGKPRPVLLAEHLANQHGVVFGQSGMGKSALLFSLVKQKIENRETVILIDPHPSVWLHVLDFVGMLDRDGLKDRLCIIDATSPEHGIVGINVLEREPVIEIYEIVAELISALKSIWRDSWGARMEDVLRNCLYPLIEQGMTLVDVPRFLVDDEFRQQIVDRSGNEEVKLFWLRHFADLRKFDQRQIIESSRNKISALVSNPYVRAMVGQKKSTVKFRDIIDHPDGAICLIHLSRARLKPESQELLSALLFAKIYMAILSREDSPEHERRAVNIFVDEATEVWQPDSMLNILSGGRKFGARLWLFFQSVAQLPERDLDLILNGAAVQMVFNIERADAERLVGMFPLTGTHVKYLDKGLYGEGRPVYYTIGEERENAIRELTNQRSRQCFIKVRGSDSTAPYIAEVDAFEYPAHERETEVRLRHRSAKFYARSKEELLKMLQAEREALAPGPVDGVAAKNGNGVHAPAGQGRGSNFSATSATLPALQTTDEILDLFAPIESIASGNAVKKTKQTKRTTTNKASRKKATVRAGK